MGDSHDKYKKELKELFERVSYEVNKEFGIREKPGIEFSYDHDHGNEKSDELLSMACYSDLDDKIYITSRLLKNTLTKKLIPKLLNLLLNTKIFIE
ncbi:MAG: hypothetical protein J7K83_03260 [Candidatus Aenigmarchaeota archaeon]|nr:hypothetical protein [Candidatus Aenigmarchaeota archaeon]